MSYVIVASYFLSTKEIEVNLIISNLLNVSCPDRIPEIFIDDNIRMNEYLEDGRLIVAPRHPGSLCYY